MIFHHLKKLTQKFLRHCFRIDLLNENSLLKS